MKGERSRDLGSEKVTRKKVEVLIFWIGLENYVSRLNFDVFCQQKIKIKKRQINKLIIYFISFPTKLHNYQVQDKNQKKTNNLTANEVAKKAIF